MSVIELTLDAAIIEDYITSFSEHYAIINNCVGMLDQDPSDEDVTNEVFRSLHTIKGNADMCQLSAITQYTHALEDVVADIRDGNLVYEPLLGEILLLCLDKTKEFSQAIFDGNSVDESQLQKIQDELKHINSENPEIKKTAQDIIKLISGHILEECSDSKPGADNSLFVDLPSAKPIREILPCPYKNSKINEHDLEFLRGLKSMYLLMEQKIPYWRGRLERTLPMAMAMNEKLKKPVNSIQLEAAVYVHDVSFAFLSNHLLQTDAKFDQVDLKEMQQHPDLSANLLKHVKGWEKAATFVCQHHERWDGSGYPNRLKSHDIHAGSQILAIVDCFESMTSIRADRQYKRSVLRAVTEINNCAGTQFSPDMVLVFNSVIKAYMKSK